MQVLVEKTQLASSAWRSVLSKPLKCDGPITHDPSRSCQVPQRQIAVGPERVRPPGLYEVLREARRVVEDRRVPVSSYAWTRPEPNMLRSLVQPASLDLYSAMP